MVERSIGASPVGSDERNGALSLAGRVCGEAGCPTVLSVYNDLDFCSLHQPMVVPRMRGVVLGDSPVVVAREVPPAGERP